MEKEKTTVWLLLKPNPSQQNPITQADINMFLFNVLSSLHLYSGSIIRRLRDL